MQSSEAWSAHKLFHKPIVERTKMKTNSLMLNMRLQLNAAEMQQIKHNT